MAKRLRDNFVKVADNTQPQSDSNLVNNGNNPAQCSNTGVDVAELNAAKAALKLVTDEKAALAEQVQALKQTTVAKADYDKVVADKGVVESNLATLKQNSVAKTDYEADLDVVKAAKKEALVQVTNLTNIVNDLNDALGIANGNVCSAENLDRIFIFNTVDAAGRNGDKYPQPLYQEVRGKYCQNALVQDSAKWIPSNPLGLQEFCKKTFDFMGTDAGKAGDEFDINA
jgi:hypothetical protein